MYSEHYQEEHLPEEEYYSEEDFPERRIEEARKSVIVPHGYPTPLSFEKEVLYQNLIIEISSTSNSFIKNFEIELDRDYDYCVGFGVFVSTGGSYVENNVCLNIYDSVRSYFDFTNIDLFKINSTVWKNNYFFPTFICARGNVLSFAVKGNKLDVDLKFSVFLKLVRGKKIEKPLYDYNFQQTKMVHFLSDAIASDEFDVKLNNEYKEVVGFTVNGNLLSFLNMKIKTNTKIYLPLINMANIVNSSGVPLFFKFLPLNIPAYRNIVSLYYDKFADSGLEDVYLITTFLLRRLHKG
ncbi:MAG: hypothetical protein KAT68_00675 [Bacteroidales bacterium]|nr:hypothetical protein [Bacteroidales bacterium]